MKHLLELATRGQSTLIRLSTALAPVILRLSLGALFFASGLGKWEHIERTIGFFTELGIPFPSQQARFIAALECVGGVGLALGFGTRTWALLLSGTMLVALGTAIVPEAEGVFDVLGASEFAYLAGLVSLIATGAGAISLDALIFGERLKLPRAAGSSALRER